MTSYKAPLAALLALSLAAPLWAQDETEALTETEAPAEQTEDTGVTQVPSDLSLGEPVSEAPRPGEAYVREEFQDWALRCIVAEEGADPCQLYQLLRDQDGNAVAEISMFPINDGRVAAGATIVAPLETLLTEQLRLSVDGGQTRRYPFTFCNRAGCVARVGFTQEEVDQFKRGVAATMTIVPAAAPDQPVPLTISLSGFTAGINAIGQ